MSILKCHVTIHYIPACVLIVCELPRGWRAAITFRHGVSCPPFPSLPPSSDIAVRPQKLSVFSSSNSSLFSACTRLFAANWICICAMCIFYPLPANERHTRTLYHSLVLWSAAYLYGMKRQFIFSSDNISDSRGQSEIYRIVKSRFFLAISSPSPPVNCIHSDKINISNVQFW